MGGCGKGGGVNEKDSQEKSFATTMRRLISRIMHANAAPLRPSVQVVLSIS